jgi:hypothetical protein
LFSDEVLDEASKRHDGRAEAGGEVDSWASGGENTTIRWLREEFRIGRQFEILGEPLALLTGC